MPIASHRAANRKPTDEDLHHTAGLIAQEVVHFADQIFTHEQRQSRPARQRAVFETSRGGRQRLFGIIARKLIRLGNGDLTGVERPSATQQFIAARLSNMPGGQRRRAVGIALLGHTGSSSEVMPITTFEYPVLAGTQHLPIVETDPYIRVGYKRALGAQAAAVVVTTYPQRARLLPPTAEYPSYQAYLEDRRADATRFGAQHPEHDLEPT